MKENKGPELVEEVMKEMAASCVLMRTRLISRIITNVYDEELRPFGLNSPQFALLVVMARLGPASRAEIGRFHHQDRSTLTRNLKIMLAEGWVEEVREGSGGRARPMALTKKGTHLLFSVASVWRSAQTKAKTMLGSSGVHAIADMAAGLMKANRCS